MVIPEWAGRTDTDSLGGVRGFKTKAYTMQHKRKRWEQEPENMTSQTSCASGEERRGVAL